LKQCIDHLEQYLEMEKIRFEDFQYRIQVDEGLYPDDIPMAPMLIQPLVENAIWHGLRHKAGNKKLLIRFYKKASQLLCEINDNGTGIIQSRQNKQALHPIHRSLGITNVHERLAVLNEKYGMKCSLSIVDKSELEEIKESGTLATLQLTILN
jgi:LytS/YehU family sensor histidine kinase